MEGFDKKIAGLEALLFVHGESLSIEKIEQCLGLEKGEGNKLVDQLAEVTSNDSRGLRIIKDFDKIQMVTKPEFGKILENFVRAELSEELTPASLETLSIISYLGPISRSQIEYLRGVNSVFTLRNLLLRGLIDRYPDPKRANAYLYRPSMELIRYLGVGEINELPDYEKVRLAVINFDSENKNIKDEG